MKEEASSSQPASDAATPVVTGDEASRPRKNLPKKALLLVVVLIIAAVVVAAVWFFIQNSRDPLAINSLNSNDFNIKSAQDLAKQPLPKEPVNQTQRYAMIGAYLQAAKQYSYAERYFLKAQEVVDNNNLDKKQYRYYVGIATVYRAMGNEGKAKEYDQLEEQFLEQNYSREVIDQMRSAKTDEPRGR